MGCHFLLQRIFPTQGSNPGLPHCRQMLYHLSHQGSPLCNPVDCSMPGTSVFHYLPVSEVAQLCSTLCSPLDCSLPGSSVHGIFQASVLEWVAISFSRKSSQPRDQTQVSHIVDRCFTIWATREVLIVKFRLKLKKVRKATRPFRCDLNLIPYNYTVEVTNRLRD